MSKNALGAALVLGIIGPAPFRAAAVENERKLYIEPIAGFTTARHLAPETFSVPKGTVLQFCHALPDLGPATSWQDDRTILVEWQGAEGVRQESRMAFAQCPMTTAGRFEVSVTISWARGGPWESRCTVNVIDIPAERIRLRGLDPAARPLVIHEQLTNQQTMEYFFGDSIAAFDRLRPEVASRSGKQSLIVPRYRTSVERSIDFSLLTDPPGFEAIMEARIQGKASFLPHARMYAFEEPGSYELAIGPPGRDRQIKFDVYRVIITSHISNHDKVPQGRPLTFTAVTDPPGYEENITWIASTKYGTATPVTGRGPTFTTQFQNTWGFHETYRMFQWLGVKADNVVFNQDQKPTFDAWATSVGPGFESFYEFGAGGNPVIPAGFFEPGSAIFSGIVNLTGVAIDYPNWGMTDTVISRPPLSGNSPETVPIELVQLNLQSASPIMVTGGANPGPWLVAVALSNTAPPPGTMTATQTGPNGGTFTANVPVQPWFIFVSEEDLDAADAGTISFDDVRIRDLDTAGMAPPINLNWELGNNDWVRTVSQTFINDNGLFVFPGNNDQEIGFIPGITAVGSQQVHKRGPMAHVQPGEKHYVNSPNKKQDGEEPKRCYYQFKARAMVDCDPPASCPANDANLTNGKECTVIADCKRWHLIIKDCSNADGLCTDQYKVKDCR